MLPSKPTVSAFLLLSASFMLAERANAWAFYWSKVDVKTSSWQTCMDFALAEAKDQHLTQIKRTNLDVSGLFSGGSATITCIGTGGNSKALAVVMVVGDADGPVRQHRDALVSGITSRVRVD